jgi:hypothetical protein
MNLRLPRITVPARLRHQTRVTAIQCPLCGQWRKPRHIRIPAMVCRDCESTPAFQSWKPTRSVQPTPVRRHPVAGGTR